MSLKHPGLWAGVGVGSLYNLLTESVGKATEALAIVLAVLIIFYLCRRRLN